MKSSLICLSSSLLLILGINFRAEAHTGSHTLAEDHVHLDTSVTEENRDFEVMSGVDLATFIDTVGIDDFLLPTPETFSDFESLWVVGVDRATFIATGEDTDGQYTLAEFLIPLQSGAPPHIHLQEDEWYYITEGELSFRLDDQPVLATPETLIFSPSGQVHTFTNLGTTSATMLVVWKPSGIEELFREVGDPVTQTDPLTPPFPPSIPRLIAAAPDYGLQFVPPENNNSTPVPESSFLLSILIFGAFGTILIFLKHKQKFVK